MTLLKVGQSRRIFLNIYIYISRATQMNLTKETLHISAKFLPAVSIMWCWLVKVKFKGGKWGSATEEVIY